MEQYHVHGTVLLKVSESCEIQRTRVPQMEIEPATTRWVSGYVSSGLGRVIENEWPSSSSACLLLLKQKWSKTPVHANGK